MARLTVSLLGPFQVWLDGQPVTRFPTDKERALLAYLVTEADRPHRREALAALLWGGLPEDVALSNLRRSLHRLRRTLGDDALPVPFIELASRTVQFNLASNQTIDLRQFLEGVQQIEAHRHRRAETCEACRAWREAASGLGRGDFMQGFALSDSLEFDEWLAVRREQFRLHMLDLLEQLAGQGLVRGEYERARRMALRQIELEPWREIAHRQLMVALTRSGQRAAALAQYEACRRVLATELGAEPEEATTALYQQIKSGQYQESGPTTLHNLPASLTPFFGREAELARLSERLLDPAERLITIVGEGGVGKTRLALQAAQAVQADFVDGVWFASLAGLQNSADIPQAIAAALGFNFYGAGELKAQLLDFLHPKDCLLLLDNFEHVMAGADLVDEILKAAPRVVLLITSREPLTFQAERVVRLDGLPVPPTNQVAEAGRYSSVQLFVERAERSAGEFALTADNIADVVQICQLVEGLPLGIVLAASQMYLQSPHEMAQAIRENFETLAVSMRDLPERQRNLRAVFEWSWALLSPPEQLILPDVSVFRSGFTASAAEAVTQSLLSDLLSLVNRSLLRRSASGRFEMHELLRQFAAEKLGASNAPGRHSAYYLAYIGQRQASLIGSQPQAVLAELQPEFDNLKEAWRWAVRARQWALIEQGLAGLTEYCDLAGLSLDGLDLLQSALRHLESDPHDQGQCRLLSHLYAEQSRLLNEVARYTEAAAAAERAIEMARQTQSPLSEAQGQFQKGRAAWHRSDYVLALAPLEEALTLARAHQLQRVEADVLRLLSNVHLYREDFEPALFFIEAALDLYRAQGNRRGEAIALNNRGNVAGHIPRLAESRAYIEQALELFREIGFRRGEATALANLGEIAIRVGDYPAAQTYLTQCIKLCRAIGDVRCEGLAFEFLGYMARNLGNYPLAQSHYENALRIHESIGMRHGVATMLACLCLVYHAQGQSALALARGQQAVALASGLGVSRDLSLALTNLGHVLLAQNQVYEALQAYTQAIQLREELKDADLLMESKAGLARAVLAQGNRQQALREIEAIFAHLNTASLSGADEPARVWWACYEVLRANADPRAIEVLRRAASLVQAQAEKIGDEALRRAYLENVPEHRAMLELMAHHH